MRSHGVEPGHSMQLLLQLEDEYTHKMILEQKFREKEEVVLVRYLEPPKHGKDGTSRFNLFEKRQHYQFIKVQQQSTSHYRSNQN